MEGRGTSWGPAYRTRRDGEIGLERPRGKGRIYPRPPYKGRSQNFGVWGLLEVLLMVLGRGGVDPFLGGGEGEDDGDRGEDRALLEETVVALASIASRLEEEARTRVRLQLEVDRLRGQVGELEGRMADLVTFVRAAIRGDV